VHAWQVSVEDDDVVAIDGHMRDRVGTIERQIDRHPLPPQAFSHGRREPPVILDNKHPHRPTSMSDRR